MNWNNVPDQEDFSPIPEGIYPCVIDKAEEKVNEETGNIRWDLKWKVAEGEYKGKQVSDMLFFHSEKCLKRAKMVFKKLGIPLKNKLEVSCFNGKKANLDVIVEPWETEDGKKRKINKVSFSGYFPFDNTVRPAEKEETKEKRSRKEKEEMEKEFDF